MRAIAAAVVAGLWVFAAVWGSAATANADGIKCSGQQGPNPASPEFYRKQYNQSIVDSLKADLATYHSAVSTGDPAQIGDAATPLYSEIVSNLEVFGNQEAFGCYSPTVLASLKQATDTLAPTYDSIASAGANCCGKTRGDVPGLVKQAKPQERAYIDALNGYASQFGGKLVPHS